MKFKRTISCLLLVVAVISVLLVYPVKAEAASGQCGNNLKYSFSSGTLTITGSGDFYNAPATFPPYNSYWSFSSQIKKVVIKANITTLPSQLFMSCSNLKSVTLPDSVTTINYQAFSGCSSLTTINFPKSLTYIGESVFAGTAITEAIIPEGVTAIEKNGFSQCEKLQKVVFLGTLTDIKNSAFSSCDALTTVEFSGVKSLTIGEEAFAYCTSLKNITLPEGLDRVEEHAFVQCISLESVDFPESLTSLGGGSFRECDGLTYVTIPKTVNYIGSDPFVFCENLQGVTIHAETVAAMKKRMLSGCDNLHYVHIIGDKPETDVSNIFGHRNADADFVIYYDEDSQGWEGGTWETYWAEPWGKDPSVHSGTCGENLNWRLEDGVLTISGAGPMNNDYYQRGEPNQLAPWYRFRNDVQKLVIEDGVTTIGASAFVNMTNLTEVSVAKSVTEIYEYAFYNCDSLTEARIGKELTKIGYNVYEACNGLTTVYLEHSPEDFGTNIFMSCLSLNQVHIGPDVTSIPDGTFANCIALKEVTIPANVKSLDGFSSNSGLETVYIYSERIEQSAFEDCKNLSQVYLMDTVEVIGDCAFYGCSALTELIVPASVKEISLRGMNELRTIRFLGDALAFDSYAFSDLIVTAYYPADNPTWTEDVRGQYDGTVTWVAYTPGQSMGVPGDVNGDGKVNNKDASCLFQYLSGWDVAVDEARLDINADGKVNNKDASCLFQYLSGWDVQIF